MMMMKLSRIKGRTARYLYTSIVLCEADVSMLELDKAIFLDPS